MLLIEKESTVRKSQPSEPPQIHRHPETNLLLIKKERARFNSACECQGPSHVALPDLLPCLFILLPTLHSACRFPPLPLRFFCHPIRALVRLLQKTVAQDRTGDVQRVRLTSKPLDHRCSNADIIVCPQHGKCRNKMEYTQAHTHREAEPETRRLKAMRFAD